jgi:hypothetical protein
MELRESGDGLRWAIGGAGAMVEQVTISALEGPRCRVARIPSMEVTAGLKFEITNFNIFASLSPFAVARLLGLSIEHARIVQLAAALLVAWVWSTNATRGTRAAVLTAGTLIAVPYALLYHLMIAA